MKFGAKIYCKFICIV